MPRLTCVSAYAQLLDSRRKTSSCANSLPCLTSVTSNPAVPPPRRGSPWSGSRAGSTGDRPSLWSNRRRFSAGHDRDAGCSGGGRLGVQSLRLQSQQSRVGKPVCSNSHCAWIKLAQFSNTEDLPLRPVGVPPVSLSNPSSRYEQRCMQAFRTQDGQGELGKVAISIVKRYCG